MSTGQDITNVTWREGDSTTLPEMSIGSVLLTVMGAAYHWMDRYHVVQGLDRIIEPGGVIVLASGGAPGDLGSAPLAAGRRRGPHPLPRPRAPRRLRHVLSHPKERHQDVLARSPFFQVDTARWDHTLTPTVEEVIGWVFSLSYSSPAQLGEKKDAFERDLREALLAFTPSGRFDEVIRAEAVIATRP